MAKIITGKCQMDECTIVHKRNIKFLISLNDATKSRFLDKTNIHLKNIILIIYPILVSKNLYTYKCFHSYINKHREQRAILFVLHLYVINVPLQSFNTN